jgi:phosphoribosyl 1,2-cyclic phosphodiesterase
LLIDAGTGALTLNGELAGGPTRFSILLTHLHWDHTLALPFFGPLYDPRNCFDFYGTPPDGMGIEDAIDAVMQPPWFPVSFRSAGAEKYFHHLNGAPFTIADIEISHARLYHPQGVTGYRLQRERSVLVVATDVEHGDPLSDRAVRQLAAGADVLIYDAQYYPEEHVRTKKGWGHSTWEAAVALAEDAGVGRLLLTSHDPSRTDESIDRIVSQARARFPNTDAVAEGMKIEIP